MTGSEQLLGGYWFLKELLYASLISFFCVKFILKSKKEIIYLYGAIITFVLLAFILSIVNFKIPTIGSKTMLASSYFLVGYTYKKTNVNFRNNLSIGATSLLIVSIVAQFFHDSIDAKGLRIFLFFAISLMGIFGVICLADFIKGKCMKFLDYVGTMTLDILTFHFISFKLVSLLIICLYHISIENLSSFPYIADYPQYWVLYTLTGIFIPLMIRKLITNGIKIFKSCK